MVGLYQYANLTEPGHIRLVVLQPATSIEDVVQCSLITVSLDAYENSLIEQYTALSYVWGDPKLTNMVKIDGKHACITKSLDVALRHMRDKTKAFMIWADGLCIDQANVQERNEQVTLMGRIYGVACHTIIFLGDTLETGGAAEEFKTVNGLEWSVIVVILMMLVTESHSQHAFWKSSPRSRFVSMLRRQIYSHLYLVLSNMGFTRIGIVY
jgi:hypothetical protein